MRFVGHKTRAMASPPLKRFWDTSWSPCQLNADACLNLDEITGSFSAPITEEHAWAIVFECLKCLRSVVRAKNTKRVLIVSHTDQILIHREGRVHESTFLQSTSCHESCELNAEAEFFSPFNATSNFLCKLLVVHFLLQLIFLGVIFESG